MNVNTGKALDVNLTAPNVHISINFLQFGPENLLINKC